MNTRQTTRTAALLGALALGWTAGCRPPDPWKELERKSAADRATPQELVRLGEHRAQQGQTLEAFELALRARKADPGFAGAHHLAGILYLQVGDFDKAGVSLREALRLEPGLEAARINLARLELARGEPVAALGLLRESLKRDRASALAWTLTGQAQQIRGSPQRAAASYRQAVALDPKLAEAHASHGALEIDLGAYQRAIPLLDRAYALEDRNPTTLVNLATALIAGRGTPEDTNRADALLAEAGRPSTPSGRLAAGLVRQQQGDFSAAQAEYEAVLRAAPRHERALYGLGETLRAQGERARSAEVMARYDRIVKQRQRLRTMEERLNLAGESPPLALLREYAVGLFAAEQFAQAKVHFESWARRAPGDPEPKRWLARIAAKGGAR